MWEHYFVVYPKQEGTVGTELTSPWPIRPHPENQVCYLSSASGLEHLRPGNVLTPIAAPCGTSSHIFAIVVMDIAPVLCPCHPLSKSPGGRETTCQNLSAPTTTAIFGAPSSREQLKFSKTESRIP
ncbi:hypothetical protein GCM10009595_13570 [Falsarthrobacter nasiphocae]